MAFIPSLFRIQEIEIRLQALTHQETELTKDSNLVALRQLVKETERRLTEVNNRLSENRTATEKLELELSDCVEHLKLEENKLYNGKVSNPRELEQIQQKMGEYQLTQTHIEEEILNLLENGERYSEEASNLNKRRQICKLEMDNIQKGLHQKMVEIKIEKEELQAELENLIPQIPPEWMERYRRIAASHRGIGIAKIKNNTCGACHVSLSESLLQKVKRGDDGMKFCENCGRILYY